MDAWFQTEVTYPFVPQEVLDAADSVRASLPNKYCDPKVAATLFDESIAEYLLCDELGINVVCTEHHAGINSLLGANPMLLSILASQTRKVRVLSLGTLVTLRPDPVRIAEEYATADVLSRGRLELGFVKSGLTEYASNQANPINNGERYWEAIDLIAKALTYQEGPFSWEGKHFTHRHVNIWPRPYQQGLPRMWSATGDPSTSADVGRRDIVQILVLRGPEGTKMAFAANRKARREAGMPKPTTDRFAYAALVAVGNTHEEGVRVGSKLLWFLNTSLKSAPQFGPFLPGNAPPEAAPGIYRTKPRPSAGGGGHTLSASANAQLLMSINTEQAMQRGILFCGSPDTVYEQIMNFYNTVGGFDHLAMVGRSGFMTHEETKTSLSLFGKHVLPRMREIKTVTAGFNQPDA